MLLVARCLTTSNKKLLVAPGHTTSNKKLLGAPGLTTNGARSYERNILGIATNVAFLLIGTKRIG